MRIIAAAPLIRFSESILLAAGAPAHKASVVADSLVAANLRGVDSHGIQLLTYYIDQLIAMEMDAITDGAGRHRQRVAQEHDDRRHRVPCGDEVEQPDRT